jgi:hypothetical protein
MDRKLQTAIKITRNHLSSLADELRKTPYADARLYMALYKAVELGVGSTVIQKMDPDSRRRLWHVIAEEISAIYRSVPEPGSV